MEDSRIRLTARPGGIPLRIRRPWGATQRRNRARRSISVCTKKFRE
jgi:hypothetical protein